MSTNFDYKQRTMELFDKMRGIQDTDDKIQIRNQIVNMNLPLVTTVLKKYKPYTEDHFQIGCIGLIKAADTYESTREVPFHNYACFVIERELQMDFNHRMETFEQRHQNNFVYLDANAGLDNGDEVANETLIADEEATRHMEQFIEDNSLEYVCNVVIKPSIKEIADSGRKQKSKVNFDVWEKLEFRYLMSIVFEESQKKRFNLTQMAKECGISLPNIRNRHIRVMDIIFQRMWNYMTLTFSDLLERIRGKATIPSRLLCLDPGKTTGWCLFEDGKLTRWGQVPECYDERNIDVTGLTNLFKELDPDFILYEDYRVYSNKLDRHSFSPVMTVRLLGVIETYCQMNGIPSHKQMATTAKNFCTDAKLEQWGFWQTGMRHARDAIRHGCYFLLFYKKGQDIM